MIRINLLPYREYRRKAKLYRDGIGALAFLVLLLSDSARGSDHERDQESDQERDRARAHDHRSLSRTSPTRPASDATAAIRISNRAEHKSQEHRRYGKQCGLQSYCKIPTAPLHYVQRHERKRYKHLHQYEKRCQKNGQHLPLQNHAAQARALDFLPIIHGCSSV
mgnify:CR=1 FL=1